MEVRDSDRDDVEHGLLRSEAGTWPVLGGIAVLTDSGEAVVPLVERGRYHEAAAEVAFRDHPRTPADTLASRLDGAPALVSRALDRWRARERVDDAALFGAPDPRRVLERVLLRARSPMPDADAYFRYRFSLPRHLVALQLLPSVLIGAGPVLDLGCGAGHMTFSLMCLRPEASVVGVDVSYAQLWVARRLVAPRADYVCADARQLPFADGSFASAASIDVLSFVRDKWAVVRELLRVVEDGGPLAVSSMKDDAHDHVYAGLPLSTTGWRRLFGSAPHLRLLDDELLLDRYLAGKGLPEVDEPTTGATVSLLVASPGGGGPPDPLAHARGPLAVNPLYRPVPGPGGDVLLQRTLPGGSYVPDNARLLDYLPPAVTLPRSLAVAGSRGERPDELLALARQLVVLALPPGYVADPWPGARASDGRAVAW